jgi:hypothetical protein
LILLVGRFMGLLPRLILYPRNSVSACMGFLLSTYNCEEVIKGHAGAEEPRGAR